MTHRSSAGEREEREEGAGSAGSIGTVEPAPGQPAHITYSRSALADFDEEPLVEGPRYVVLTRFLGARPTLDELAAGIAELREIVTALSDSAVAVDGITVAEQDGGVLLTTLLRRRET